MNFGSLHNKCEHMGRPVSDWSWVPAVIHLSEVMYSQSAWEEAT